MCTVHRVCQSHLRRSVVWNSLTMLPALGKFCDVNLEACGQSYSVEQALGLPWHLVCSRLGVCSRLTVRLGVTQPGEAVGAGASLLVQHTSPASSEPAPFPLLPCPSKIEKPFWTSPPTPSWLLHRRGLTAPPLLSSSQISEIEKIGKGGKPIEDL
jgi:hypothetical protein